MSVPAVVSPATRAVIDVLEALTAEGFDATRDPGAFFPQPVGILVGLPTLASRGTSTRTYTIPVLVVSGDPFNALPAVDRALELADAVALYLRTENFRPSSWRSSVNAEPLPAFELSVTHTVPEREAAP